jgi:GDP/UDP-N,N'-diacetylbacillosamine 2-epimerase (hydrolysing)
MRKVLYVTGTRADFGLMLSTLRAISASPALSLSLAVCGMHLSAAYGHTVDEVRASGLSICAEIPMDMEERTPTSMAVGVGACLMGLTQVFAREKPDIVLLLGDRGEMLAGAIAALHLGIVCVHIHGGERSGTVDEPVRHAISKLSHYHLWRRKRLLSVCFEWVKSPQRFG